MASRYQVRDGIVIRRTPLPSGDLVATLLSPDGKWRALARKGKLPGGNVGRLSLFHDVTVQLYRRRDDDLALLTQVTLNGALPRLSRPEIYPYAHLLAELADQLTVDVHLGEQIYAYLASGLRGLDGHPDPEAVALVYAWRLLKQAGLAPRVEACVHCGRDDALAYVDVAAGGLACDTCRRGVPLGADAVAELRRLHLASVARVLQQPLRARAQQWRLLRRYLAYHVRDLRSLDAVLAAVAPHPAADPDDPVGDATTGGI